MSKNEGRMNRMSSKKPTTMSSRSGYNLIRGDPGEGEGGITPPADHSS